MTNQADGQIVIKSALDNSAFEKGAKKLENSAKKAAESVSKIPDDFAKAQAKAFAETGKQCDEQIEKVDELDNKLKKIGNRKYEINITRGDTGFPNYDYDGPIRKDTGGNQRYKSPHPADPELMVKSEPFKEANKTVNELRQNIERLKAELKSLEKSGKWWGDEEYDKAALKLEQMQQAAKDYKSELFSPAPDANPFGLDTLAGKVREAEIELNKLSEAGKGLGDAEYDQAYKKLAALNAEAREYKKTLAKDAGEKSEIKSTAKHFGKLLNTAKNLKKVAVDIVKVFVKMGKAAKSFSNIVKKIGATFSGFGSFGKKAEIATTGLTKAFKMLLRYGLGVRSLFVLVNKMRNAVMDGIKNLVQYSNTVNASVSSMMSAMTKLKNSFATAFSPILTVVSPLLTSFINMCSKAATAVGMFFAALTGQTTFTQAKAVQEDYAKSLSGSSSASDSAAKSAENNAKATDKATKAAKGSIAAFDELNLIQMDTADAAEDLADTDTSVPELIPENMFEEVPIKNEIKSFADRIKSLIKKQDWKSIGKLLGNQINKGLHKVNDTIRWDNIGKKIQKGVNAITGIFNSMVDKINWAYLGNTIGEGLNTIVRTMNLLMEQTDFKNLGKSIAEALNGLMDTTSWEELGRFFGNRVMVLWDTLNGAVHELHWNTIGTSIAEALNGTFARIDLAEIGDTIATAINGVFTSLQNFTATFHWDEFAKNIKDGISKFLSETNWEENGKALGDFITHLCDTISDVMTLDNFITLGQKIGTFLSELPWGTMLKTAALAIVNALGGLLLGAAETPAGKFVDGLVLFLGSAKLVGKLTKAFQSLFGTAASNGADGAIGLLKKAGTFAKFASAIGIGAAVGTAASEKTTSTEADLKSTEQLLINFSDVLDDLKERGVVSGDAMQKLQEDISAISSATSPAETISLLRDALVEANVSSDELAMSISNTDASLGELYNVMATSTGSIDTATEKTKTFSQAIQETDTSPLIEKLNSLQNATDKVSFADLILKSANAIDQMGGIWEGGKQILGEKAIAIHEEIVNNGLNPDSYGFYKLANGQMVQYGQGIEDYKSTLKDKTKSTLDAGLMAGIEEALPEQQQIGWDMGGYFITGYTSSILENKRIKTAYQDALANVDTTAAAEKAKTDGEELAKNTGEGFQEGLEAVSSKVADSTSNMMEKSVKEPAEEAVDAHSPSRWFAKLATFCGQGFGNNLEDAFSSTFAFFGNFRARISNCIGSLYIIGYNYLVGMNNGMVAGAAALYKNAKTIASNLTNIFTTAWKIHSPSKVAEDIGGYYMEGMYNEMNSWADKILDMFENFAGLMQNVKFDIPKIDIPVAFDPVSSSAYTQQIPVMAQGKAIPPKTVRDYNNSSNNAADIEYIVKRVLQSMQSAGNDGNESNNGGPEYISLNIDGQELIRWLRYENKEFRKCNGYGMFV